MDSAELDDFLALAAMAPPVSLPKAKVQATSTRAKAPKATVALCDNPDVPSAMAVGAMVASAPGECMAEDDEAAELLALVRVGQSMPGPRWEQRHWTLMAHARHGREMKRQRLLLATEEARRNEVDVALRLAAAQGGPAAQALACLGRRQQTPTTQVIAESLVLLATQPVFRSAQSRHFRKAQAKSLAVLSQVLVERQRMFWCKLMDAGSSLSASSSTVPPRRLLALAVQWDETSQKFAFFRDGLATGERRTRQAAAQQVMVISGTIASQGFKGPQLALDPWFARSLVLSETSADFLVEALLRTLPIDIRSEGDMERLSSVCDMCVFSFSCDRASANLLMVAWMAEQVERAPTTLLPWCELCLAHGCALIKARADMLHKLASALQSFTHWLRHGRNAEVLRQELRRAIAGDLEVRYTALPADFEEVGQKLMGFLFTGEDSDALWCWNPKLRRQEPTPLKKDLDSFCRVANFAASGPRWVHVCRDESSSNAQVSGRRSPCCKSRAEAIEKTVAVVATAVLGRAWKIATLSRWTNVTSTLRKFCFLNSAGGFLVEALKSVKAHWGLNDGLVPTLSREIAKDQNDFPARNKLRLLRIVKGLGGGPVVNQQLALATTCLRLVDDVLFGILGGPSRERVSLATLLHPFSSPICRCQERLLGLASCFAVGAEDEQVAEGWELLAHLGGGVDSEPLRLECRRVLLQLSAGITDIMELRMEKPPYSLCRLIYDDVPRDAQARAAQQFFDVPEGCLPLFARRLKQMHPRPTLLLERAPPDLTLWATATYVSIDFSERAHSQMRHDIASRTVGANYLPAANKLLVRQYMSEHVRRGGHDLARLGAGIALETARVQAGAAAPRQKQPQSKQGPRRAAPTALKFANLRRKAWKALVAPDRPLTASEQAEMEEHVAHEWERIKGQRDLVALYRQPHLASVSSHAVVKTDTPPVFRGPCAVSTDPGRLVPQECVVAALHKLKADAKVGSSSSSVYSEEQQSASAHVASTSEHYTNTVDRGYTLMFGCFTKKQNVCRDHSLPVDLRPAFDTLVRAINAWTGSLSKDQQSGSSELLAFVGRGDGGDLGQGMVMVFELLVLAKGSPKMQFFGDCGVVSEGFPLRADRVVPERWEFPLRVRILDRTARLSDAGEDAGECKSLSISTSDEVALFLLSQRPLWELVPVQYRIETAQRTLLDMSVFARGEVFQPPVMRRKRASVSFDLPAVFDLDPVAHGRSLATSASSSLHGGAGVADAEPALAGEGVLQLLGDFDDFLEIPEDVRLDMLDGLLEAHEISSSVAPAAEDGEDTASAEAIDDDGLVRAAEAASSGHVDLFGGNAPEDDSGTVEATAAGDYDHAIACARAAIIDDQGSVTCPLQPFDTFPLSCGRLTQFPKDAPHGRQNVSMRCHFHGCSAVRRRARFTDEAMLRWLFSGVLPTDGASQEEMKGLRRAHEILATAQL